MKCKNCGAELNNGRCEYCGSRFSENMRLFTLKAPEEDTDFFRKVLYGSHVIDDSRMYKEKIEVTCLGDAEPHFIEG